MIAFNADKIRDIVNFANEQKINREDIVSLLESRGSYTLIYYR